MNEGLRLCFLQNSLGLLSPMSFEYFGSEFVDVHCAFLCFSLHIALIKCLQAANFAKKENAMTLLEYLNSLSTSGKQALAEECKTTVAQINQVAYGYRKANVFLATDLNCASGKVIALDSNAA